MQDFTLQSLNFSFLYSEKKSQFEALFCCFYKFAIYFCTVQRDGECCIRKCKKYDKSLWKEGRIVNIRENDMRRAGVREQIYCYKLIHHSWCATNTPIQCVFWQVWFKETTWYWALVQITDTNYDKLRKQSRTQQSSPWSAPVICQQAQPQLTPPVTVLRLWPAMHSNVTSATLLQAPRHSTASLQEYCRLLRQHTNAGSRCSTAVLCHPSSSICLTLPFTFSFHCYLPFLHASITSKLFL